MKLYQIEISNFRSIINQKIDFDNNCIGLIGLNESGKSNVLSAIRALERQHTITAKDKCKINGKYPFIEYKFKFEEPEIILIKAKIKELFAREIDSDMPVMYSSSNFSELRRIVKIEKGDESLEKKIYYEIDFTLDIIDRLYSLKPDQTIPDEVLVKIQDIEYILNSVEHIHSKYVTEEIKDYFDIFDKNTIVKFVEDWLDTGFESIFPQIIFWEYEPKYLLSSEITYEALMLENKPYENSAPLFNILKLSTPLEVKTTDDLNFKISVWQTDASERRKDSSIITESVNTYIKSIWSDYNQDLVIALEETKITIHINDPKSIQKNYYEMEARSQGFKTFISFILTIAAEAENGIVNNFILLLDEPETHLHPSGVRYMKEELLKLSKKGNNIIIYSTHSIFMIDRSYLKRHIIVSKEHEITKLTKVERNNLIQEDVIYEAMGTTIDEFSIGLKNIIFEGELDLKLFDFMFKEIYTEGFKNVTDFDTWDGGGTKKIEQFLTNKMLAPKSD